jgi:hypothetical protein
MGDVAAGARVSVRKRRGTVRLMLLSLECCRSFVLICLFSTKSSGATVRDHVLASLLELAR